MFKRMIFPLVVGVVGVAILVGLGTWQVQRLAWKEGVLEEIDAKIAAAPVALPDPVDPSMRYLPVEVDGTFGTGEVHVLVSRKQIGAGYLIIAPFETTDGRTIMVDRGFVLLEDADAPRGAGATHVTGTLHWPDDRNGSTPDNDVAQNVWFARDIPQMAEALGADPVLVVARSDTGGGIEPMPVGVTGIPNDHLQYAITWFSLAIVWLGMTLFLLWRIRTRKV